MKPVLLALLLLGAAHAPRALARQQPSAENDLAAADARRASELYRQGDMKGAASAYRSALKRRQDDPLLWLGLGQALAQRGDLKEARKAIEQALRLAPDHPAAHAALAFVLSASGKPREAEAEARRAAQLDPRSVDAHYVLAALRLREGAWLRAVEEADAIAAIDPRAAVAYSLRGQALLGLYERGNAIISDERRGAYDYGDETVEQTRAALPQRLREAADNFEKYLQLRPDAPDAADVREQVESLRLMAGSGRPDAAARIYTSSEPTDAKAVILSKPEPSYTEEARRAGVAGRVVLRAVLAFDGRVRYISVMRRLPHGLTEQAVAAARRIKFKPATVAGLPVSQWVTLEYNFSIF